MVKTIWASLAQYTTKPCLPKPGVLEHRLARSRPSIRRDWRPRQPWPA